MSKFNTKHVRQSNLHRNSALCSCSIKGMTGVIVSASTTSSFLLLLILVSQLLLETYLMRTSKSSYSPPYWWLLILSSSIISVSTSSAILGDPSKPRDKLHSAGSSSGSWFGTLIKLFLFAGVCVGALYGYKEYSRRNGGFGGSSFGGSRARGGTFDMWSNGKRF